MIKAITRRRRWFGALLLRWTQWKFWRWKAIIPRELRERERLQSLMVRGVVQQFICFKKKFI